MTPPSPRLILGHTSDHLFLAGALFVLTLAATWFTWGPLYSVAIMVILLCHEMGHYLMCRRYRVRSTLPLFIPMPFISPFGTMGAIILMRQRIASRRAVFDIGIAGPLAGLVPALAACFIGLAASSVVPTPPPGFSGLRLGDSLLFALLQRVTHPSMGPGTELMLHPVAYAGWAGLFVTALNLLPVGQLDGGHVVYGLLGRRARWISLALLLGMAALAVTYPQWWVLVALLLLFGFRGHPPAADERVPLDRRRQLLGLFAMLVFVLAFTPRPFLNP